MSFNTRRNYHKTVDSTYSDKLLSYTYNVIKFSPWILFYNLSLIIIIPIDSASVAHSSGTFLINTKLYRASEGRRQTALSNLTRTQLLRTSLSFARAGVYPLSKKPPRLPVLSEWNQPRHHKRQRTLSLFCTDLQPFMPPVSFSEAQK